MIVRVPQRTKPFFSNSDIVPNPTLCYAEVVIPYECRVIIYGDSVLLAGVQASLAGISNVQIILLDQPRIKPAENLLDYHPDAVIFDLGGAAEIPLAVFQRPDLVLIGINPETHETVVWSGKNNNAIAAVDLVDAIISNGRGV